MYSNQVTIKNTQNNIIKKKHLKAIMTWTWACVDNSQPTIQANIESNNSFYILLFFCGILWPFNICTSSMHLCTHMSTNNDPVIIRAFETNHPYNTIIIIIIIIQKIFKTWNHTWIQAYTRKENLKNGYFY